VASHTFRPVAAGSPEITVDNSMLRGVRVLVDGRPAVRQRERGRPYWLVPVHGGGERRLYVTGTITGLRAVIEDEDIQLEPRLAWWELLLAFLPLSLATLGGVVGGVVGAVGMVAGLWVMRRPWPAASRVLGAVGVLLGSGALWLGLRELIIRTF